MSPITHASFGGFRFDAKNECLWRGGEAIALRPKAFAVLRHLVEHPSELVTKQQLLDAVWPDTFVSDAVLKDSIRQLREALGDDASSPRYIETAHRRGYRFICQLSDDDRREEVAAAPSATVTLLGRDGELERMRGWLDRALGGQRQVVFVTGEPGIGKTTLVTAVLHQAAAIPQIWIARGQCLEQYGAGEAYLPVLDALSRLGRGPRAERVVEVLRSHAPAWLLELPSLLPAADRGELRHPVGGATRERMLREMAEALEALTADAPAILLLEDLHWSDHSTLDLIAYLARRRDPARLMVIGTYRPVDAILGDHPLKGVKRELQAHGLCHELPLEYLTEEAVWQYLAELFPRHALPKRLARLIHARTEGNPLFMVNLVEYLVAEAFIVQDQGTWRLRGGPVEMEPGVPDNIRQLIEKQIERLSPDERRVLEGASVVGMECSTVAIGAGLAEPTDWVETHCEALVRRHQFLSPARIVELPDGSITPRYKFSHVLYLEVPYGLLPRMRRVEIHRRIGKSGESVYGDRVGEIAAELAMHFEQGLDCPRAAKYLAQAAENALQRCAHHEAASLARRGLQVLATLPETPERDLQELNLRLTLGISVMAVRGFAAAEVEEVYTRALDLCARHAVPQHAFRVRWLLGLFRYFRAELREAFAIAEQLLELARELADPFVTIEANRACGVTLVDLGRFEEAMTYLDTVIALYDSGRQYRHVSLAGQDPKVMAECYAARAHWALGEPDRALARAERAVSFARELSHGETLVIATHFAAHIHQLRGEASAAKERAETVIALADEYGLELWSAFGQIYRGWAVAELGEPVKGIEELRQGLAAYEATGASLWKGYSLGLLARALARAGRFEQAQSTVADALSLVQQTGEQACMMELRRVQASLREMRL